MSGSNPAADDSARPARLTGSMNNVNTAPVGGAIDPAAIALIGTYAIDLTAMTRSDIAVPDMLPVTVA